MTLTTPLSGKFFIGRVGLAMEVSLSNLKSIGSPVTKL